MAESKFFTNQEKENRLFDKMDKLFNNSLTTEFKAVSGFFRSSGYFKLRDKFKDNKALKLKILVGINVDKLTASYSQEINSSARAAES